MDSAQDLDRARDALRACDPECTREEWLRLAMASKAAGLDLATFDAWSAQADNYRERDTRALWQSIRRADGIGPGTLFKVARERGWRPLDARPQTRPMNRNPRTAEPSEPKRQRLGAAEAWGRFKTAAAHAYIDAKHGRPEGLRVVPDADPLTIAGQRMAGALVVPVLPFDGASGEPIGLQFIGTPEQSAQWKAADRAGKLNLPGSSMAGVFIVGDLLPGGTAFVCEGIGQAWACWKAAGHASVVCFGWGRVRAVAEALRQRDAAARLVLVPDKGKEDEAERIALDVAAAVAKMPADAPPNFDANDYAAANGHDALDVLLSGATEPAKPAPRYRLLASGDLHALPPLAWRIRGVLPAHGLASFYGASASGKSFLAFDAAAAIAAGRDWFGYRVKPSPVVYCALEGEAGFRLRVEAWEQAHGDTLPAGLRMVLQAFKLTEAQDVLDLAAAVRGVGDGAVTILDTLNRAAPEADENASADMGRILEAAKELQRLTAGLVVVVHHSGKDAARGLRGHSSLFAALDAAVEVTRDGDARSWRVAKAKDGADGEAHPFRLEVIDLAPDADGEPVSSCVVRRDTAAADVARVKLPQGGNQKIILAALRPMFKASPNFGKAGAPAPRPCIELEAAITAAGPRLVCASDRRAERTRDAIKGLVSRGLLGSNEGWLWLV